MANNFNPMLDQANPAGGASGGVIINQAIPTAIQSLNSLLGVADQAVTRNRNESALREYNTELDRIQSGIEQKKITTEEGDRQRRQLFRTNAARYPQLADAFHKTGNDVFGYDPNFREAAMASSEAASLQAVIKAGSAALGPTATRENIIATGSKIVSAQQRLEMDSKQLTLLSQQLTVKAAGRSAEQAEVEDRVQQSATGMFEAILNPFIRKITAPGFTNNEQNLADSFIALQQMEVQFSQTLQKHYADLSASGAPISDEMVNKSLENARNRIASIRAYLESPSESLKRLIEDRKSKISWSLLDKGGLAALAMTLPDSLRDSLTVYMAQKYPDSNDWLRLFEKESDGYLNFLDGKTNLTALSPEQQEELLKTNRGHLENSDLSRLKSITSRDKEYYEKALQSWSDTYSSELSPSNRYAIIDTLTSPRVLSNINAIGGAGANVTAIGRVVAEGRADIMLDLQKLSSGFDQAGTERGWSIQQKGENLVVVPEPFQSYQDRATLNQSTLGLSPEIKNLEINRRNTIGENTPMGTGAGEAQKLVARFNRLNGLARVSKTQMTPLSQELEGSGGNGKVQGSSKADIFGDITPEQIMGALTKTESNNNPTARSPKGAMGIAQVMPETAANPGFGMKPLKNPDDPNEAIPWATEYLGKLHDKYKDNLTNALIAYNWGTGNVDKWLKEGGDYAKLPLETKNYLVKFIKEIAAA